MAKFRKFLLADAFDLQQVFNRRKRTVFLPMGYNVFGKYRAHTVELLKLGSRGRIDIKKRALRGGFHLCAAGNCDRITALLRCRYRKMNHGRGKKECHQRRAKECDGIFFLLQHG